MTKENTYTISYRKLTGLIRREASSPLLALFDIQALERDGAHKIEIFDALGNTVTVSQLKAMTGRRRKALSFRPARGGIRPTLYNVRA